jgi:hypothetical protein
MIKFLITTAAIIFLGLAGVTYSKAAECTTLSKVEAREEMAKIEGVEVYDLTKAEIAKVLDKKGVPPNAVPDAEIEMELVAKENIRAINVYQNGCFINRLGPTSPEAIDRLLDRVPA